MIIGNPRSDSALYGKHCRRQERPETSGAEEPSTESRGRASSLQKSANMPHESTSPAKPPAVTRLRERSRQGLGTRTKARGAGHHDVKHHPERLGSAMPRPRGMGCFDSLETSRRRSGSGTLLRIAIRRPMWVVGALLVDPRPAICCSVIHGNLLAVKILRASLTTSRGG